jgi:hypothetical protein
MKKIPFKKICSRLFLILFGLILGLLATEAFSKLLLFFYPSTNYVGRWEFRKTRPLPYKDANYFNKEFLDESMKCVRGIVKPQDANFIIQGDFAGKYFNVKDGKRKTCYQPSVYKHTVFLFGGSTVFCQEVPDEDTIASHLQMMFLANGKNDVIVENYGMVSMIAAQQTDRLLQTPLNPGDVVIFFDGFNDVIYPVYNGNTSGWLPGHGHDGGTKKLNWLQRFLYPLSVKYSNTSATAKLFMKILERIQPVNITDKTLLKENLKKTEQNYKQALIKAHNYVNMNNGSFYHFLQPNIFTLPKHSKYEKRLIDNILKKCRGMDKAIAITYPRLRAACDYTKEKGVKSFDLTGIFNQRTYKNEEFYLDYCHCNHTANKCIASSIYDIISKNY